MKNFSYKGYWKKANSNNWEVTGSLNYDSKSGISLELLGSLEPNNEEVDIDEIHGFISDGRTVTLTKCGSGFVQNSMPGIKLTTYKPKYCSINKYYEHSFKTQFNQIAINYTYLDEWVDIHGFKNEIDDNEKVSTVHYKQPETIELYNSQEFKALLWFSFSGPQYAGFLKENRIEQKVYLNLVFEEHLTLDEIEQYITIFRYFLSLAWVSPISATDIVVYDKTDESDNGSLLYLKDTQFPVDQRNIFVHYPLFTYNDICNNSNTIIERWIQKQSELEPVIRLYFDTIYNPSLYQINSFLNFVFAIETFHRRTRNNCILSKPEFKKRKKEIIDSVNDEHKNWLKEKLNYANEPSLKERLTSLIEEFDAILSEFEFTDEFINKVVDTRNYHVHFAERLKSKIIFNDEFPRYNLKLQLLIQTFLLTELQFEQEKIKQLVGQPFWNKTLKRKNNRH